VIRMVPDDAGVRFRVHLLRSVVVLAALLSFVGLSGCSGNAHDGERKLILSLLARPTPAVPAGMAELYIKSLGRLVYRARCAVTTRDGRVCIEEVIVADMPWSAGVSAFEIGSLRLFVLTERYVVVEHMADDFPRELVMRGTMRDLGHYVSFRTRIRSKWGLAMGEYEIGLCRDTGRRAWSALVATGGYTDLYASLPLGDRKLLQYQGRRETRIARSLDDMDRYMCPWMRAVPDLLVAAPYLRRSLETCPH